MTTTTASKSNRPALIQAIIDAFKLPDLRTKILFTLFILVVFRFFAHVPVPGVDKEALQAAFDANPLLGFIDIFSNNFLNFNITGFLPSIISYLSPLILGAFGLHFIRIEYSGNKTLDRINKNLNSSNINAILSLIVIFILIKYVPYLLNWFFFDACLL